MPNSLLKFLKKRLVHFYHLRKFWNLILKLIVRLEGCVYSSNTLRSLLSTYHTVDVNSYTNYGSCLIPEKCPKDVRIGRFASIVDGIQVFRRN